MKPVLFCVLFFGAINLILAPTPSFAQSKAAEAALNADTVESAINILKGITKSAATTAEKLDAAEILASLQEQLGMYSDASYSYTTGASLAGVQTVRGQKLLLGAVRCALSVGDVSTADFLLSTAFSSATDTTIKASVKLYAVWSWIIKAEDENELAGPISVLKSYSALQNMESVKPSLLLTLYHLTGEKAWADQLQQEFPNSPEASVVSGQAQLLPAPFWFFISNKN